MGVTQMPSRAGGRQCVMQGLYRIVRAWELFSRSVVSDSLQPHGLQHDRLPFPSPSPRACSDSSPLSWWCHPTISFSVVPFSSCLQSFPVLGFFLMSQLFASGSQKIGASASNDYSGLISFRIDWFDLLAVQVTLKSLLQHHSSKVSILPCSAFIVHLSFRYMTTGKTIALTLWSFVGKVMSLLFNILFSVCQSFSPKEQASFNFMSAVIICSDFGAQENKVWHCFHCFPIYLPWSDGTRSHDLRFLNVEF